MRVVANPDDTFLCQPYFMVGLRVPADPFIKKFLMVVQLAPCQLNANAYQILYCYIKIFGYHQKI